MFTILFFGDYIAKFILVRVADDEINVILAASVDYTVKEQGS